MTKVPVAKTVPVCGSSLKDATAQRVRHDTLRCSERSVPMPIADDGRSSIDSPGGLLRIMSRSSGARVRTG